MPSTSEVDLCGITWPVCLLKFKTALNNLAADDVLEVLTRDPEVAGSITMIVNRSRDKLINQQKEGPIYRLSVERGA
jgi:TusA-related sulfurtransferase